MGTADWSAAVARGRTAAMSVERVRLSTQIEQLARTADEYFSEGYIELLSSLERQMRSEEAVMESMNNRALRSHQEEHARVLAALHQIEPRVEEGNVTLGREALALLDQWLLAHRASMDLALLTALTPMGRRRPLEGQPSEVERRRRRPPQADNNSYASP